MNRTLAIVMAALVLAVLLVCGCAEKCDDDVGEKEVTITILYSEPSHVELTEIYIDGEIVLRITDTDVSEEPYVLGETTLVLEEGDHDLRVVDKTYDIDNYDEIEVDRMKYWAFTISSDGLQTRQSTYPIIEE